MKKKKILSLCVISMFALMACNQGETNSFSSSEEIASSAEEISSAEIESNYSSSEDTSSYPSLKALFASLKELDNYTLEIDDEIFDIVTTYKFSENAMYYIPSKTEHGGSELGYAQSKNNEVFSFVIENDTLVPGSAITDSFGNPFTSLYGQVAISLRDLDLDYLSDEKSSDNTYIIDSQADPYNFLVFVALAGYYDEFAIPYLSLTVEVTGENSFIATTHFDTGSVETTGDIVCTIKDIDNTNIPYIDEYLENGGGPVRDDSQNIIDFLQQVKDSKNYTVEVTGENTHYLDVYTENYYYSSDLVNEVNSSGYVLLENSYIYKFTKENDEFVLKDEIYYETSDHSDIWGNIIAKRSFASLNLSSNNFKLTYTSNGYVLTNAYSVLSVLLSRCHVSSISGFAPVDTENDSVIFNLEDNKLTYTYITFESGTYVVTISNIGSTSNEEIEDFIEEYNNKKDVELNIVDTFNYLKNSTNYTITYTENFSGTMNSVLQKNDCEIKYADNHYYFASSERNLYYGYYSDETSAFKYVNNNGTISKQNDLSNKDISKNFKSFANFDETKFNYVENNDGSYKVENDEFLTLIAEIVDISSTNFLTYVSSVSITLSEQSITIKASTFMYGGCTFVISNVGSTTLDPITL